MTRNLLARKGAIRDLNSTWLPHKNVRAFASKMENKIPAFFNHRTFILCLCIYIYIFWGGRKGSRRTSQSRQKIKAFPLTALLFVLSVVCSPFHQNLWLIGTYSWRKKTSHTRVRHVAFFHLRCQSTAANKTAAISLNQVAACRSASRNFDENAGDRWTKEARRVDKKGN